MTTPQTADLGPVRSEHVAGSRFHYHGRLLPHTLLLFVGVLLLATAPFVKHRGRELYVQLGVGAGALVIGGLLLWRSWRRLTWRVAAHEGGLVSVEEGRTTSFRWDEIAEVCEAVTRHTLNGQPRFRTHRLALRLRDGRVLALDDRLTGIDALAETVRAEVYGRLLERARESRARGEALAFGAVGLGQEGLTHDGRTLAWAEVAEVAVERGVIRVSQAGATHAWCRVAVAHTPNHAVFLTLARQELEARPELDPRT
jgi:hypothetical protein